LFNRATERLTGIQRDTIMRLGVRVGEGGAALHDEVMQFVQVNRLSWTSFGVTSAKSKSGSRQSIRLISVTSMSSWDRRDPDGDHFLPCRQAR
jgi:hypothetical protein